ncbi:hypothetical protein DFH05DRAFT_1546449 [Lentinula detonsa]|uniref:UvrD-like helicase ATP-binding domain-containing protein n=1 Tax=Lentinula detonsa TaxID=2804962 RepID=A0A9W8NS28_9AGAR|nr:hypothetical protein DFH05DRAFT_1546449 [Lentinula detonsa]
MNTQILPDALFSSSRLTSLADVEEALAHSEALIYVNHHRLGTLIAELLQVHQNALPAVISCITTVLPLSCASANTSLGVQDHAFNLIRAHVSSLFSAEPKLFTDSIALQLLTDLSHFLYFHDFLSSAFQSQDLIRDYYQIVENAVDVLNMLSTAEFVENISIPEDEEDRFLGIRVHRKQKGKRHIRTKSKVLDPRPFKILDVEVPSSRVEADKLTLQVLKSLENILDFYLLYLRGTDIGTAIKTSFVSCAVAESAGIQDVVPGSHQENQTSPVEDTPLAFPKVQPMKSALHFDSIEGFGAWYIIISQNAETQLRTKHRKDKISFDIIIKKIKELSTGHFSADNQKRLSGPSVEVPIFEAKMTGDLRLIYQIDVVANDDEREWQAVKIFGIYTHKEMDNRLWASISRQLGRKGKEYRDRCAVRIKAKNAIDKTFVPALFPPLPDVEEGEPISWLSDDLSDEDPVHSRFLMDKYVVFSKPLLNTMLADLDVTFPHLVSTKEKQIIEHPHSCYVIGRSGTGKTTTLLYKMLLVERTHQMAGGDTPKPRQIFVTHSEPLLQLLEIRASQRGAILDDGDDMIDANDILDWSGDLPLKFSDLRDEHFPLFTTFNGLCSMLEADITDAGWSKSRKYTKASVPFGTSQRGRHFVTYEVFLRDYWPHFPQSLAAKLDPSLVFSELIGVIKGSEETLEDAKHYLNHNAYQSLSTRNQSTFADSREDLYELFMAYLARKEKLGDVDSADRAHEILDFFKLRGTPGQRLDHLYVDEVQDNLLIDTLILRILCHDENGLFWAGDTAQTISVGSSFRFNSLKAFQWRLEQKRRSTSMSSSQAVIEPRTFQLSVNYRSHSGIVDCAHSVIELITRFWKDSIDRLAPEKGVAIGLKPLFFVGWDEDAAGLDHFVFGDSGNRIEFGAQQCILVRNEAARNRLKSKLGNGIGLIMTIYDSKGLEFNDVLLYDFFGDSPAKLSQWRLILGALYDRSMVAAPDVERNKQRYASICSELKFLYVAITRARENVWIVDSSERSEPMRMYWTERDLIRNIKPGTNAPKLATSSKPEDWAQQGKLLFERNKWIEAKHCFERALQPENVAIAEAYRLREKAERSSLERSNVKIRNAQFREAAEAFYLCSRTAGRKRTLDFVRLSGNCYKEAGEYLLAARNYHLARQFNDSVRCYRKADHYEEAVRIVQTEADVEPLLAADTMRVAKMFYFSQVQSLPSSPDRDKKLKQAGSLFDSLDEQLEYLEVRDMDIAQAALLVAHGRVRDAAEVHLAQGRTLEAIDLLIQRRDADTNHDVSACRATEYILDGLWQKLTFSVTLAQLAEDPDFLKLLELMNGIDWASLNSASRDELTMFQAIVNKDRAALRELGQIFFIANSLPAALLCLDHYYAPPLSFNNLTVYQMTQELDLFRKYSQLLLHILADPMPTDHLDLRKLFGFRKLSESHILLLAGNYLHKTHPSASPGQDLQLYMIDFVRHFQIEVSNRLRERVCEQNIICRQCNTFKPCVTYAVFQYCHWHDRCRDAHIPKVSFTPSFYNARVRIHLQQILIVESLHRIHSYNPDFMKMQRSFWLKRLYDALLPPSHVLGGLAIAQFQHIVEYPEATRTLQQWIRHRIYSRLYEPITTFLSDLTRLGTLAMVFDRPYALSQSLLRRGNYARSTPPPLFVRPNGSQIVHELIGFLEDRFPPHPHCLDAAILTLWHIMAKPVPIEIGLLCDLLETLCRSLVLAICFDRDINIHNVTLPRSWLMRPICVEAERMKNFSMLHDLITPIGDLLAQIYTGHFAEHLLYEKRTLTSNTVPNRNRTIFISRVCRAISLLGYNIGNWDLRSRILSEITSLRRVQLPETQFSMSYKISYVEARSWDDIAHAVRHSTEGSAMDEMVNIVHKDRYDNTRFSPRGVRVVVYEKIETLPNLLIGAIPPVASSINVGAPTDALILKTPEAPTEPAPTQTAKVDEAILIEITAASGAKDADHEIVTDLDADESVEDVAQQAIPHTTDSVDGPLMDEPEIPEATENERRSAMVIQQAYRQYLSRKAKQHPTQLAVTRDKLFSEYMKVNAVQDGHYRKMMLGPLPHVIVFLDLLYIGILESKNNTKKRLLSHLKSEEADLMDTLLTQTNDALKKTTKWKRTLEPRSEFHSNHDSLQLKAVIREMEEFMRNNLPELPIEVSPETKAEFKMGYRGIAQEPAPKPVPSKARKPELNVEDVDDF